MFRPRGLPEAVAAVPAAGLLIALGVVSLDDAVAEVEDLLPVVGFLAAVLVLAKLCDDEGLFHAAGVGDGAPQRGRPAATAGHGVRHRGDHDGGPEPRRHRRPADPGRAGDRTHAGHPVPAARLRHRAPRQHRIAAAAGVQPDQPAGLQRGRADLRPLQCRHDAAVGAGDRRRVRPAALFFRRRVDGCLAANRAAPARRDADLRARRARPARWSASPSTSLLGVAPAWAALAGAVVLGGARPDPTSQHGDRHRQSGERAVPRVRAVPRRGGHRGDEARPRHGDARRAADRHDAACAARHRGRRRAAVQRRQQPARGAGAAAAGARRPGRPRCWRC